MRVGQSTGRPAGTSATDVVVAPVAQELAIWVETNSGWAVSGRVANGQVSRMNSGQTKGDLTLGGVGMLLLNQRANVASILSRRTDLSGIVDLIKPPITRVTVHDPGARDRRGAWCT